ncbi:MAG: (2Fe-2S)-binding protein [Vicinamibacteria bacterium]|jgi:xanthine dehydrogenase YagT iron-sulfur-binding subunit|nr:(2Fe-2S)-binding protein [Vicinamibacteria bacterium]MBP9948403.1 (2Fe-2S)-binding protein [Vicinamibacteria bacterium]
MTESDKPASRFSRRSFIKTAGAGAAVAGASVEAQEKKPEILGPDAAPITLKVNGVARKVTVEPRVTLLRALRNELEITGAKEVCDRGGCGACTVLMDGRIVNACMIMAWDAVGHEITTVESFGTPEKLSPIQAAFVECDGLQCGFCTPGMIVSCTALLKENPAPTRDEVKAGLAGNLCRCGTYSRIFDAVDKAAKDMATMKPAGRTPARKGE